MQLIQTQIRHKKGERNASFDLSELEKYLNIKEEEEMITDSSEDSNDEEGEQEEYEDELADEESGEDEDYDSAEARAYFSQTANEMDTESIKKQLEAQQNLQKMLQKQLQLSSEVSDEDSDDGDNLSKVDLLPNEASGATNKKFIKTQSQMDRQKFKEKFQKRRKQIETQKAHRQKTKNQIKDKLDQSSKELECPENILNPPSQKDEPQPPLIPNFPKSDCATEEEEYNDSSQYEDITENDGQYFEETDGEKLGTMASSQQ